MQIINKKTPVCLPQRQDTLFPLRGSPWAVSHHVRAQGQPARITNIRGMTNLDLQSFSSNAHRYLNTVGAIKAGGAFLFYTVSSSSEMQPQGVICPCHPQGRAAVWTGQERGGGAVTVMNEQ